LATALKTRRRWQVRILALDGGWPMPNQAELRLTFLHPDEPQSAGRTDEVVVMNSCDIPNLNAPQFSAKQDSIFGIVTENAPISKVGGLILDLKIFFNPDF
jgi:hypothetical protein